MSQEKSTTPLLAAGYEEFRRQNSGDRIDTPTDHAGSTPTFFYCILTPGSWIL
jgi:hypothetical protein